MSDRNILQEEDRDSAPFPCQVKPVQRILEADDDSVATVNTDVLISFGYRVDAAEDGAAAWEALQVREFKDPHH